MTFSSRITRSNVLKIITFLLLLVLYGSLVTYKIPLPVAEDLPRQMQNGEEILQGNFDSWTKNVYSYTDPNHYFANHHWLYGVIAFILYQTVGWSGMVVFKVLFILLTFTILFKAALIKANFWVVSLASIPAILMLMGRSSLRPEMFGYFFICLYVYLLLKLEENPKTKIIYLLIPAQLLWANLHITFPIGIMIVGAFLFEKIIFNYKNIWSSLVIKRLIVLLGILIAVSFINPNGIKGVIYSMTINTTEGPVVSAEVQPLLKQSDDAPSDSYPAVTLFIPLLIVSVGSFIFGFRKRHIFYLLGITGAALLTFKVVRSFPFFAIFFLLTVPANLNGILIKVKNWLKKWWPVAKISLESVLSVVVILIVIVTILVTYPKPSSGVEVGFGLERYSEDAAKFFNQNELRGPIFNDTDIGSYITWYMYPRERVFADNRFGDAYTNEFFENDYLAAFKDEESWKKVLDKYKFNTIFLYQYNAAEGVRDFIFRRINDPDWSFIYGDRYTVILVRNITENEDIIKRFAITTENAQTRFAHLLQSTSGVDLVTVGDLFGLMGQIKWARGAYSMAVSQNPDWSKIWFVMGRMELMRGDVENSDPALALLFLEQAISRGWKTVNSYSFLALAHYRLGHIQQAKDAVLKELDLNPESDDAKQWLETFAKDDAARLLQE